jgi:hypothetical protein
MYNTTSNTKRGDALWNGASPLSIAFHFKERNSTQKKGLSDWQIEGKAISLQS